jgi:hypothetical protein
MRSFKSESSKGYGFLRAGSEIDFYHVTAKYLFENQKYYLGRYTVWFFSVEENQISITKKLTFKSEKTLKNFKKTILRQDYNVVIGEFEGHVRFIVNGKYLTVVETFLDIRRLETYNYDQELKDRMEGNRKRPPRTSAFGDMIIGKIQEQLATETKLSKRKLAS